MVVRKAFEYSYTKKNIWKFKGKKNSKLKTQLNSADECQWMCPLRRHSQGLLTWLVKQSDHVRWNFKNLRKFQNFYFSLAHVVTFCCNNFYYAFTTFHRNARFSYERFGFPDGISHAKLILARSLTALHTQPNRSGNCST